MDTNVHSMDITYSGPPARATQISPHLNRPPPSPSLHHRNVVARVVGYRASGPALQPYCQGLARALGEELAWHWRASGRALDPHGERRSVVRCSWRCRSWSDSTIFGAAAYLATLGQLTCISDKKGTAAIVQSNSKSKCRSKSV
jgi:hypothetical protein